MVHTLVSAMHAHVRNIYVCAYSEHISPGAVNVRADSVGTVNVALQTKREI